MKSQMIDLAFAGKCGARGAMGSSASAARRSSVPSKSARASIPKPAPAFFRNSRRFVKPSKRPQCEDLIDIDKLIDREDGLAQVSERLMSSAVLALLL